MKILRVFFCKYMKNMRSSVCPWYLRIYMVSAYYHGGEKAELLYAFFTLAFTGNRLGDQRESLRQTDPWWRENRLGST